MRGPSQWSLLVILAIYELEFKVIDIMGVKVLNAIFIGRYFRWSIANTPGPSPGGRRLEPIRGTSPIT